MMKRLLSRLGPPPTDLGSIKANLSSRARWEYSAKQVLLWLAFGWLLTSIIGKLSPGQLIVVGSDSVPVGVYWLNTSAPVYAVGRMGSFQFNPPQQWLRERFGHGQYFTKRIAAVAGDTVIADAEGALSVCRKPAADMPPVPCAAAGSPLALDSKGRPMQSWLSAGQQYTLRSGEVWVYGENRKSLDSRYYGPVSLALFTGEASPVITW